MKPIITRVYPNYAEQKVYVQWEVEEPPSTGIVFTLYRSDAPNGDYTQVGAPSIDTFYTIDNLDNTPGLLSFDRPLYYKIKASSGSETAESMPVYYDGTISADPKEQRDIDASYRHMNRGQYDKQLKLLRNKLITDFDIGLKKIYGVAAILLKRKHFGKRCSQCYDEIANKIVKSHCLNCYATSWVGGYTPYPILVHETRPQPIQIGKDIAGPVEIKQMSIVMPYFPKVNSGDIVVMRYNNLRYYVKAIHETYIRIIPVHQTIILDLIPAEHIVYHFPIDSQEGQYNV